MNYFITNSASGLCGWTSASGYCRHGSSLAPNLFHDKGLICKVLSFSLLGHFHFETIWLETENILPRVALFTEGRTIIYNLTITLGKYSSNAFSKTE